MDFSVLDRYLEDMPKSKRKEIGQFFTSVETAKYMASMFEKSKNINLVEPSVTIKTALNKEARENLEKLAEHLI